MLTKDEKSKFSSSMGRIRKPIDMDENEEYRNTINVRSLYFRWIIGKLDKDMVKKYSSLLMHLFKSEFIENAEVPMDVNRARDGVALRKKFISEQEYFGDSELESIQYEDCSWLEMLIALAERIDDQMMFDMNLGNMTNKWFCLIIDQMGLKQYNEQNYVYDQIKNKLNKFIRREYENDGKNGIFRCNKNVTKIEIWYQMMEWFNENDPKVEF